MHWKSVRIRGEGDPVGDVEIGIADNYATHKHIKVRGWMKPHPRFHVYFTPTSASWLNMVERFLGDYRTHSGEAFSLTSRN